MKQFLAISLCFLVPALVFAGDKDGFKVVYDGGSMQNIKTGKSLHLSIEDQKIQLSDKKESLVVIPAASVTEISYGQDVHRRIGTAIGLAVISLGIGALMALSKSKKHFIGITWDDGGKKGGLALQADKNDYRGLLAGLEGVTGKKAVNSDTTTVKN